jgi:hypothetical protein
MGYAVGDIIRLFWDFGIVFFYTTRRQGMMKEDKKKQRCKF